MDELLHHHHTEATNQGELGEGGSGGFLMRRLRLRAAEAVPPSVKPEGGTVAQYTIRYRLSSGQRPNLCSLINLSLIRT